MVYIEADSTLTWGELFPKLRDELTTQTGWTLEEQHFRDTDGDGTQDTDTFHGQNIDIDGDGQTDDDEVILLSTPTGEYISFQGNTNEYVYFRYGDSIHSTYRYATGYGYGYERLYCITSTSYLDYDDPVTYWLSYDANMFQLYYTRNAADGYDHHGWICWAEPTGIFDWSMADINLSGAVFGYHNGRTSNSREVEWFCFADDSNEYDYYRGATAAINPDVNFDDYVVHHTATISANKFQNNDGYRVPVATLDGWVMDRSGSDTAHGDIIQDDAGNNKFVILKQHDDGSNYDDRLGMLIL